MFAFITIGTNNLKKSGKFYDQVLSPLKIVRSVSEDRYIGYSKKKNLELVDQGKKEFIEFYLMYPYDKKIATKGNGTMIVFNAKTKDMVDKFYQIGLEYGGTDEGLPGPRHQEHYYAYIRDLDGNKICAFATHSNLDI